MSDVFSKSKRSYVMSRIRSRGNKDTEVALAKFFRRHKITGWRRQVVVQSPRSKVRSFKVRPDFVFPKLRLALFVDGCFWHGCPQHGTQPKGNATFWHRKFSANKKRDQLVNRALRKHGWRVLRIWEHTLRWATQKRRKKKTHSTPHAGPLPERSAERKVMNRHEAGLLLRIQRALGV